MSRSRRLPWQRVTAHTIESNNGMISHSHVAWSSCSTLLAVVGQTTEDEGQIDFVTHSGTNTGTGTIQRPASVTSIAWHPQDLFLAAGWSDGSFTCSSLREPVSSVASSTPNAAPIMHVEWSHNGKTMCIVDEAGHVHLYSFSVRNCDAVHVANFELGEKPTAVTKMYYYKKADEDYVVEEVGEEEPELRSLDKALKERDRKLDAHKTIPFGTHSGTAFLIATSGPAVHSVNEGGNVEKLFDLENEAIFIGFFEERHFIMIMTKELMLIQMELNGDKFSENWRVKLPGKAESYQFLLAEELFIVAYRTRDIRVWDLIAEENALFSLSETKGYSENEVCVCLAHSKKKGTISCGTSLGNVANFRKRHGEKRMDSSWRLQSANQVEDEIRGLAWSEGQPVLAVNTGQGITILRDEHNIVSLRFKIAAIQSGPTSFTLLNVSSGVTQELKLSVPPVGIHVADKQLVVHTKESVITYDVQTSLATIQSTTFSCTANDVCIYQQTLYCLEEDKINARTLQGTVRQIISFPEMEGDPVMMNMNRHWLVVVTTNGFIRIYNVSKKDARQEYHSKYIREIIDDFFKWCQVRVNISGNRVACTYYTSESEVSEKVVVFDAEEDSISFFSFDKGMTDQQEYEAEAELAAITSQRPVTAAARKMEREQSRFRMMLHRPGAIHWDENDDRFLVCEAVPYTNDVLDSQVLSMFVTQDHGIQLHDLGKVSQACERLIGVVVPHMYFIKRSEFDDDEVRGEKTVGRLVIAKTLREFAGLDHCDDQTRKAMLDFSLYLALGRMDDAFKAIKFIKSETVWEQMATMAVKTRRMDVVAVCLGHMRNVRGAKALHEAQKEGESVEMQTAAVAIQLGMIDEAEAIYAANGRYDMVNKIEQAQGAWKQAFDVAANHDRIHLRNTHYNFAKYCEEMGAIEEAVVNYERSGTHQFEVLRMLREKSPQMLDNYIRNRRDPEIQKYWARYLESFGELEGAANFYMIANDILSFVRIRAMQGKTDEAAKKAMETGDQAACFHMAKVYEGGGDFERAVTFYTKARAFSSAIRIAKEQDMKDKLANLCLLSGGNDMVDAARYYENIPGYAHQAVMLYHKAGMIGRALDLAFRTEQFSALDLVVKDLDPSTDPNTLKRAAEFFESNQSYERAAELLCMAKQFPDAITLCKRKNVQIKESLAELLTPTKETTPNVEERKELLLAVAELCIQQGSYIIAAKKYTQAGDKIKAMRSLLRSGDTQKIRFFANTARSKEIYILAANYLQTTDWKGDVDIVRDIETFYAKAQSPEHLANFYIACAHMEVENYNDFEKAGSALDQAALCLDNAMKKKPDDVGLKELRTIVDGHVSQLQKFQKIKGVYSKDPADAVRQLQTLAEEAGPDDVIKPSHIFTLLIGHHADKENWSNAYRCITQLKKQMPNFDLSSMVATETLDKICDEMRVERVTSSQPTGAESDDDGDEVDFSHAMKRQQAT